MSIVALYADGGVIGSNPSAIGGTYAWRAVHDDGHCEGQGYALPANRMDGKVTNNQTEMLALLVGFSFLPWDFAGTVYSDSAVTLGRVFNGWKWANIPQWMHEKYRRERARFIYWMTIQSKHVLLDGHPTKAQLAGGVGKRGHPVSEHNVWCDRACTKAGQDFLQQIGEHIPTMQELQVAE